MLVFSLVSKTRKTITKKTTRRSNKLKKSYPKKLLWLSIILNLFIFLKTELVMLENLITSSFNGNIYMIEESKVKNFMSQVESPTITFEIMIKLNNFLNNGIYKFPLMIIPSNNLALTCEILNLPSSISIKLSSNDETYPIHYTQIRRKNLESFIRLIFVAEYSISIKLLKLFYINFESNTIQVPTIKLTTISESINYNNILFILQLNSNTTLETSVKNLSIINKKIQKGDPSLETLFLGLAQFQNAVYFHMEPSNSKYLKSRSPFNFLPLNNGVFNRSQKTVSSFYSYKTKQIEWILLTPFYDYFDLDLACVSSCDFY